MNNKLRWLLVVVMVFDFGITMFGQLKLINKESRKTGTGPRNPMLSRINHRRSTTPKRWRFGQGYRRESATRSPDSPLSIPKPFTAGR